MQRIKFLLYELGPVEIFLVGYIFANKIDISIVSDVRNDVQVSYSQKNLCF